MKRLGRRTAIGLRLRLPLSWQVAGQSDEPGRTAPMPSRQISLAILAFWLATVGWFIVRDGVPFLRLSEPPPYSIAMADETLDLSTSTRWTCTLNGTRIGTVGTALAYRSADDTIELQAHCAKMTFLDLRLPVLGHITVSARNFEDKVRVTRVGELREMRTAVTVAVNGPNSSLEAQILLTAQVRGGRLERRAYVDVPGLGFYTPDVAPTDPPRGSMLNPMHPALIINGLKSGQTWRQPLTDPRTDILRAALAQWLPGKSPLLPEPPSTLSARVLPQPQSLEFKGAVHRCFVIEYRDGEDYIARTWVRMTDGAVLRQEASAHGEKLVLQRQRAESVEGAS
jgi:hypothetical protein